MNQPISSHNPFHSIFTGFEKWLAGLYSLTEVTQAAYLIQITYFLHYLAAFEVRTFNSIDNELIYRYAHFRKEKKSGQLKAYRKSYVDQRLAILDFFFTWAYQQGHCRENPVLRYKKAQLKSRSLTKPSVTLADSSLTILTEAEIKQLCQLKVSGDDIRLRNQCMVLMILASALYASEVIALTPQQCPFQRGYLMLEEEGAKRRVPLTLPLCQTLGKQWLVVRKRLLGKEKLPLFFFNQSLQPLSKRMLYKIVAQTLEEAGIHKAHLGPDMLRQTAVCQLLKIYPPDTVKQFTGLKNIDHYQVALANLK
jgi:site-specific recombinase XerD